MVLARERPGQRGAGEVMITCVVFGFGRLLAGLGLALHGVGSPAVVAGITLQSGWGPASEHLECRVLGLNCFFL